MRALALDERTFSLLWQAYYGTNKQCSMQELGIAARLLTKLKETSTEDKSAPAGRKFLPAEPPADSFTLFLEEDEWTLMKQFYESTPWHTMAAVEVVAFKEFLDKLPEYKNTPALVQ